MHGACLLIEVKVRKVENVARQRQLGEVQRRGLPCGGGWALWAESGRPPWVQCPPGSAPPRCGAAPCGSHPGVDGMGCPALRRQLLTGLETNLPHLRRLFSSTGGRTEPCGRVETAESWAPRGPFRGG